MLDLNVLPNKTLELKFTGDSDDKLDVYEALNKYTSKTVLADLLEPYTTNGWGFHNADQLGQMSDSPIIAEESTVEDDGSITLHGKAWYYASYQILCPVEELLKHGSVIFQLWDTFDGENFGFSV